MKSMIALLLLSLPAAHAAAQVPTPAPATPAHAPAAAPLPPIVSMMPEAATTRRLNVRAPAIANGTIPHDSSQYGSNRSVALDWSAGPAATRSYVVIVEDSDVARDGVPVMHWIAYNIPATTRSLPAGLPNTPDVPQVPGMRQVLTAATNGMIGYRGPRTPAGQTHHYHFQVFAVDAVLNPADGPGRAGIVAAMKGHVLAFGETVATFTGPATAGGVPGGASPAPAPHP